MTHPLTIIGNEGSPYSRKMRAVLRYRRIPHRWVVRMGAEYVKPPKVPVEVIPVLVWHDEDGTMRESMVDSTPQIHRLEREFAGRSLMPDDPALAFLSSLIEDFGDQGARWRQQVFPYQVKCPRRLREEFAALSPADQAWLREALDAAGCGALVAG